MAFMNTTIQFKEYPKSVKLAILFLILGWGLHYVFYFKFLMGDETVRMIYLQVGIGTAICYLVASINRWAKVMCIFFNLGIIVLYLLLFAVYLQSGKQALSAFTLTVALLFCLATYSLLRKETRDYFNVYNMTEDDSASAG